MTPRSGAYLLAGFFVVAGGLGLRLNWCLVSSDRTTTTKPRWGRSLVFDEPNQGIAWLHDEYLYYVSTAVNAFHGRGFLPDYNRVRDGVYVPPPLQPALILVAYEMAGSIVDPRRLFAAQALLAGFMLAAAAETGRKLVSPTAGITFALLVAVYPDFVFWTGYLMTEANFLVGLTVLLLLLVRWRERPEAGRAVAGGLCLGLLNLQRGYALYLGPLLAFYAVAVLGWRRGRSSALAFLAVPLLVLAPWLARNLLVYGEPILVNSNVGISLHACNNETLDVARTPYWEQAIASSPGPFVPELESTLRDGQGRLRPSVTYYRYSQQYLAVLKGYLVRHPLHFLRNYALKVRNAFVEVPDFATAAVPWIGSTEGYAWFHVGLLAGGLAGLALALRTGRPGLVLMAIVFAYFIFMRGFFLLERQGRWDLPLRLFLMLFLSSGAGLLVAGRGQPRA